MSPTPALAPNPLPPPPAPQSACALQIRRIRERVFASLLRQEVGFFDLHSAGDLSTLVADSTMTMAAGMGQKLGVTIHNLVRCGRARVLFCVAFACGLFCVSFLCVRA